MLGLTLAFAVTTYLSHQGSIALPLLSSVTVDGTALGWTLLIAVGAAVRFWTGSSFQNGGRQFAG